MKKLNKQQEQNKPVKKKKVINWQRVMIVTLFGLYIATQIFAAIKDCKTTSGSITYNELMELAEHNEIKSVQITKNSDVMYITKTNDEVLSAVNPKNDTFIRDIMEAGVDVELREKSLTDSIVSIVLLIPLTVILIMIIVYLTNTIVGGSTKMFTILRKELNNTTFDDIKGLGKTKSEVQFIVKQLQNWKELGELGARPCKGALLYGPPGTGKTMLAKAIAKEAGVNFISASGSDFSEVFVGVGAARVRSLWDLAASNTPCILFIDEIDCLGKRRKGGDGASQDHNQTLNALLQKMDGINVGNGILVIGATNRKNDLDDALLRPGRFDRQYFVGPADNKKDRDELVNVYLKNKKLDSDITIEKVSKLMVGLTGAEVEEALNQAVYNSLQDDRKGIINLSDVDSAIMRLHTSGVEKEHSSKRDEEISTIHEAGHTLVSLLLGLPIAKVSTIPYSSGTGGMTVQDLDEDGEQKLKFESDFINKIKVYLAGKCAEEIKYNEHTQGCSNDIEQATKLIYVMITEYGYSKRGFINENILIDNGVSHLVEKDIFDECNKTLVEINKEVLKMLNEHKDELYKLYDILLEKKTLVQPTLDMLK